MAYLNKVFLIGNLTRDPEVRVTPKGTSIAAFGIGVNRTACAHLRAAFRVFGIWAVRAVAVPKNQDTPL